MIVESKDRRFYAELSNFAERQAIERAGGADPGSVDGRIEVRLAAGTPAGWAAQTLRELAAQLEAEAR